jgi:hypothetical protein
MEAHCADAGDNLCGASLIAPNAVLSGTINGDPDDNVTQTEVHVGLNSRSSRTVQTKRGYLQSYQNYRS